MRSRPGTKPLLLTFDVEEFDWPNELNHPLDPATQLQVTDRGVQTILALLARRQMPATFFVTGHFAQARPERVQAIAAAGHEIAVHGLVHCDEYDRMDEATALDRLRRARTIIAELAGCAADGVRTPRLRPCAATLLRRAGFRYDASPHPTWVPGRYNGLHWPRAPWREDGIVRIPISVMPVIRIPVSWLWFRMFGRVLGGGAIRAARLGAPYLQLYFHPWEALDIRAYGIPRWLAWRTGPAFVDALDHLLAGAGTSMTPMTIRDFLASDAEAARATP